MVSLLRRYRWWILALLVVSGLAMPLWSIWPKAASAAMRERYERVRIGMTPAEINEIMGRRPMTPAEANMISESVPLKIVARDPPKNASEPPITDFITSWESWGDHYTLVTVGFRNGKAIFKVMEVRVTPSETKLRDWLRRLGISIS